MREWLTNNAEHILLNCKIDCDINTVTQVISQFNALCHKNGHWRLLLREYHSDRGTRLKNPISYFRDRRQLIECTPFAETCLAVLSIIPSEASVERMFSTMKQTYLVCT